MHALSQALDGLAFAYALLFFPAPFFWIVIHSFIGFWRRFGNRAFWVAVPLWLANAAALGFAVHHLYARRLPRNPVTAAVGAVLVLGGLGIGRHVHRVFGLRRLGGLPEVNPSRYPGGVVRSGLFAHLRHPRYVEYMISFAGWALLTGALGNYVLAMVTILMYLIVAPLEEGELRRHYGEEYAAYARAVPRFIPRLRSSPAPRGEDMA